MNRFIWKILILNLLILSALPAFADGETAQPQTQPQEQQKAAAPEEKKMASAIEEKKPIAVADARTPAGAEMFGAVFDRPYTVRGITYYRMKSVQSFKQSGLASWYGKGDHGKKTSSGERYNMFDMTAAHKQLPLGSLVRVDCSETGKTVVVRVNDRGPHVPGRIIDLSYAAASQLELIGKGLTKVDITLINGTEEDNEPEMGNFSVQLASFSIRQNAEEVAAGIANAVIEPAIINGTEYFRVRVVGFTTREDAVTFKDSKVGTYPNALIISE